MARKQGPSKKAKADRKATTREITLEGGSADGQKMWVIYPLPERIVLNMGQDPYYYVSGSVPLTFQYDPEWECEGSERWQ